MERTIRTFVALPIAQEINQAISDWIKAHWKDSRIRFVRQENRHITIKFLGNILPQSIPKILNAVEKSVKRFQAKKGVISVGKLGFFPGENNPRVFWIGIEDQADFLGEVFRQVENELRELGFSRDERAFHAHVTLARLKQNLTPEELKLVGEQREVEFGSYAPDRIIVFKSLLSGKGARYEVLGEYPI